MPRDSLEQRAALAWFDIGVDACRRSTNPARWMGGAHLLLSRAQVLRQLGDIPACETALAEGLQYAEAMVKEKFVSQAPWLQDGIHHFRDGIRFLAADIDIGLGRVGRATQHHFASQRSALDRGDRRFILTGRMQGAYLAAVIGDWKTAAVAVESVSNSDFADLGESPMGVRAYLNAAFNLAAAWTAHADGAVHDARSLLEDAISAGLSYPEGIGAGFVLILGVELANLQLLAGDIQRAARTLEELDADDLLETVGHAGLLRAVVNLAVARGDDAGALKTVTSFLDAHANIDEPLIGLHVHSACAAAAHRLGEHEAALFHAERSVAVVRWLSGSGELESWRRSTLLTGRLPERAVCFQVAAAAPAEMADRAGKLAFFAANVWRENTLAAVVASTPSALPDSARGIAGRLSELIATQTRPSVADGGLTLHDYQRTNPAALRRDELRRLRDELSGALGSAFAQLRVPIHDNEVHHPESIDELYLSATVEENPDGTPARIVSSWLPGDGTAGTHVHEVGESLGSLLTDLSHGLSIPEVEEQKYWEHTVLQAADDLRAALIPRPVYEWLSRHAGGRIRYAFDGALTNLPLGAIPVWDRTVVDVVSTTRVPFFWGPVNAPTRPGGTPRVLAFIAPDFGPDAQVELASLRALHAAGQVELTVAARLADLPKFLAQYSFDVLTVSAHGDGRDLAFSLRTEMADGQDALPRTEVLAAHEFLTVSVPRTVILGACFSGRGGAVDITGVLAVLLSRGADEVLAANWAVPSQAGAQILSEVYRLLPQPGSLSAKLTAVQRNRRGRLYEWAGFTVNSL